MGRGTRNTWLAMSLIAACIGTEKNCGEDLQPWDITKGYSGDLFAGIDLAQTRGPLHSFEG